MQQKAILIAILAALSAPAFADDAPASSFSANVGVVSDYIMRGISQSQHNPALQGGIDYAHSSGVYVGTWASTVNWVNRSDYVYQKDNKVELDLYAGYRSTLGDFSYDLGVVRYYYPGDFNKAPAGKTQNTVTANTTEAYVSVGWNILTLKYNRAISPNFVGWGDTTPATRSRGSDYIDLTATYPLNETINLIGHIGHQNVKNNSYANYNDWKIGITKDTGYGVVGLAYTDTNARYKDGLVNNADYDSAYNWTGKNVAEGVFTLSYLKTF